MTRRKWKGVGESVNLTNIILEGIMESLQLQTV